MAKNKGSKKRSRWGDAAPSSSTAAEAASEEKKAGAADDDDHRQQQQQHANGANGSPSSPSPSKKKKRRSRFSSGPPPPDSDGAAATASAAGAANNAAAGVPAAAAAPLDAKKAKAAALQLSISQRLAALKAKKAGGAAAAAVPAPASAAAVAKKVTAKRPAPDAPSSSISDQQQQQHQHEQQSQKPTKRARVFELDMSETTPLFRKEADAKAKAKVKKKVNPYLAHVEQEEDEEEDESASAAAAGTSLAKKSDSSSDPSVLLDSRLLGGTHVSKPRPHSRPLKFVQPGKYVELAEKKRQKAANALASGFVSGRKAGTYVRSSNMATALGGGDASEDAAYGAGQAGFITEHTLSTLPPRSDAPDINDEASRRDNVMPLIMEWWDVELLPGTLRREVGTREGREMERKARGGGGGGGSKTGPTAAAAATANNTAADASAKEEEEEERENESERSTLSAKCYASAAITNSRTSSLVQHPVPVRPPHVTATSTSSKGGKEDKAAVQPTLHLTKAEMKRQRKLRRAERQRDIQDQQAAGLLPPPEPRLTLSNFMRVLGDEAVLDPSQMERRVMEQIQARKVKHEKMNAERKLTKEQRKEKRARKLAEDTSREVSVALFLVKDMSHRYHRTKVDLNAVQNGITGGVLECDSPRLALVIAEGGPKAIKRYTRLMTVRMKWRGENFLGDVADEDDEEQGADADMKEAGAGEEGGGDGGDGDGDGGGTTTNAAPQKFNPNNTCELVWTGMGAKRMFNSFVFQRCETSDVARKVLEAKGVAHFWDQVLVHASGRGAEFNFKLGSGIGSGSGSGTGRETNAGADGDVWMGE